jgi:hypothetical protein
VQRIRDITGQKDPSKDPQDPEEVAKAEAEAAEQAKQKELIEAIQMLEIRLKEAQAGKTEAEIDDISIKTQVSADKIGAEVEKIEAETMATETSVELADEELDFKKADAAAGRQIDRAKVLADIEKSKRDSLNKNRSEINPNAKTKTTKKAV